MHFIEARAMTARTTRVGQESALLASEMAYASSLLDQADAPGQATDTRLFLNAAESYQRTKDLLSVIELDAEQTSQFHERLAALRARLLGRT
jgi:hypothetical protein